MTKSLFLGLALLSGFLYFIVRTPSNKMAQEAHPKKEARFVLGSRTPSSASIDHVVNLGKETFSRPLKEAPVNEGATIIPKEDFDQEGRILSRPSNGQPSSGPFISESSQRRYSSVPSQLESFTNPNFLKSNNSADTKKVGSGGSSGMMSFNHWPNANANNTPATPFAPSEPTTVSGGTAVKPLVIKGMVRPLIGLVTRHSPFDSFKAYASSSCVNPKVGIYKTEDLLKLNQSPIQEQELHEEASFSFSPDPSINTQRPQDYVLQVTGCDTFLARIITGFSSDQNILLSSTLLSYTQVAPLNAKPTEVQLSQLLANLEAKDPQFHDILDAFNELDAHFSSSFQAIFGSSVEDLKNALPVIREISIPNDLTEGVQSTLTVDAYHWFPGYNVSVEWFVNGISRGFGPSWNWTPAGNSPRSVVIEARIGQKHPTLNQVNSVEPYHKISFTRSVINAISPQPPLLASGTTISDLTNSPLIPLIITTGNDLGNGVLEHCSSFTSMAITEEPISPAPEKFNISCSQPQTQNLAYSLTALNRHDGLKTLYLWAKDDQDDISSVPSTISLYLDQTPPQIIYPPYSPIYGGHTNFDLIWEITEHSARASENFIIEFFNGTSWTLLPDVASMNGPLTQQSFSTSHPLPDSNIENARFRISYTDVMGNSAIELSPAFNIRVPQLTVAPLSHSFGDVRAQSTSSPATLVFTNSGQWPSGTCSSPSLTGDAAQFSITSENCSGAVLSAGGSCSVQVVTTPAQKQAYNANLILNCGTKSALAMIMVTGGNNPPTIASGTATTLNEDTAHNFSLLAGTDLDGDSLTYSLVSAPAHGILSNCLGGTADLSCTYTPNSNYTGADSFTYQAWDGHNYSLPVTVALTISPVNDAPVLGATQSETMDEDATHSFNLNPGTDVENDTLNYIIVGLPSHGTLNCTGGVSRACSYSPQADYNGTDTFTYKVNDGTSDSNLATVTITINPINDAPVAAAAMSISVDEDDSVAFTLNAGSDIDLPAQILTYSLVNPPAHGVLSNCIESGPTTDRTCTYTPTADYEGSDSFTYRVCDPLICSTSVTTVSLTVVPKNDPPVMASNQSFSLNDTEFVDFTLSGATDIDIPAQTLSYKIISNLSQGTLLNCINNSSWISDLTCRYTPPSNFQGAISFTYKAYDSVAESVAVSTVTFNITDKTPSPVPMVALTSAYHTNNTAVSMTNSSCNDIDELYISSDSTTPTANSAGWVPCTTSPGALSTNISTMNGLRTIYIWSKDQYDNVQGVADTVSLIFDNVSPAISINSHNVVGNKANTVSFRLTELNSSSSQSFQVEFHNGTSWTTTTVPVTNGPHNNTVFNTSVFAPNADDVLLTLKITYTDLAGNQTVSTGQFRSDLDEPVVDLLTLNGGTTTTSNNSILVHLNAHDVLSSVTSFCLKYNDPTKPASTATCWKDVNAPSPGIPAAPTITFNNYYYQVGFSKGDYSVYVWVKDESGQISNNTGTLGVDKFDIFFDPGTPPRITNIQATNSNSPNIPVNSSDLTAGAGQSVYVKWHAEDNEGMIGNPMSIEYTLNDVDFLPFAGGIATNLANGANGSCSVDAGFTGCAVVPAPSSTYFKIRVIAKDAVETTVFLNPSPFNDSNLSIIAGNTEHGLNGSALSAIFYAYGSTKTNSYASKYTLVVSDDGKFFYLDRLRGLLWVDPTTGVLTPFIKTTGATTGDNGPASAATLRAPYAIVLDATNNLLIWDYNRIRKVNLTNMTISHLIGGGAQTDPTVTIAASDLSLATITKVTGTFIPLPNGDIIFNSPANSLHYRRYRASDQKVEPFFLEGEGLSGYSTDTWAGKTPRDMGIVYNPTTSEFLFMTQSLVKSFTGDSYPIYARIDHTSGNETTPYLSILPHNLGSMSKGNLTVGLDGKIYQVDRFRRNIFRYDHTANSMTNILGNGTTASAPCAEHTPATSCPVDIDSLFITKAGRVYFIDNGVVRTIDDSQQVITLFGQFPSYGNGNLATIARFGDIIDINLDKADPLQNKLLIQDGLSNEFRNFTIGSTVDRLTTYSMGSTGPFAFEVDSATGDIFSSVGTGIRRYVRTASSWTTVAGGGGTGYYTAGADGKTGAELSFASYPRTLVGFLNNKVFWDRNHWTGSEYIGCFTKSYNAADLYRQENFMGDGTCNAKVAPGQPVASQVFNPTNIEYFQDPSDGVSKYFFGRAGTSALYRGTQGGTMTSFATLGHTVKSFGYTLNGGLKVFYCNGGKLYRYTHSTATTAELPWASPTIKCKTDNRETIIYNSARNSVMFVFSQNGLDGVGEYLLSP